MLRQNLQSVASYLAPALAALLMAASAGCGYYDKSDIPPPDRSSEPDLPFDTVHPNDGTGDVPEVDMEDPDTADVQEEEVECDLDFGVFSPLAQRAGASELQDAWSVQGLYIGGSFFAAGSSLVDIESWPPSGPQTSGVYTIDNFVSFSSCGACVWVLADIDDARNWTRLFIATRATLQLDEVGSSVGSTISGTLSDVYFVETDVGGSTILEGGEGYCLEQWTFSNVMQDATTWAGSGGGAAGSLPLTVTRGMGGRAP